MVTTTDVIRAAARVCWWCVRAALVVAVAWAYRSELLVAATGLLVFWIVPHRSLARQDRP